MPEIPPQMLAQMLGQMGPVEQPQQAPMQPEQAILAQGPAPTHQVVDSQTGQVVGQYSTRRRAMNVADKKDLEYGAVKYIVRPIMGKPPSG